MRKSSKHTRVFLCISLAVIISVLTFTQCGNKMQEEPLDNPTSSSDMYVLKDFADKQNLSLDVYPAELLELMQKNPETKEFVLNYPSKKDMKQKIDLTDYVNSNEFPLLMQWDERWGYTVYADEFFALSGCGPTCLSMVCIYLLKDAQLTPRYIADFSEKNGYSISGNGSSWTLISKGGKSLGLDITEIPLLESRIIKNLEVNNPIICVMGPGEFTSTGHFIVMTKYVNGKIIIHDPNSKERSNRTWEFSQIQDQIRNLWVIRKAS